MCFRAEAETVKKGYNHATLNFFFWSTCFVKKYKKIRFIKRPIKAPYKKNGKSWKNVPKTGFEKDIYEHATQENVKKKWKMLLCAKPINTPHTKEPRAAPGAGNCIQNWSWLRGRYNHTTQENVQRKYKNVVVKEACRHATYKGARGDPCHRKLHPKVRPVAPSRPGLLYSRHMSPNLYLCEGICRYDICTDVKIFAGLSAEGLRNV